MAKRARKGQLTERQIADLRARVRQSIASKVTIIDPAKITLKAVDRILAAVDIERVRPALKRIDRRSLATELSHARVRYWSNFIDDRELPQKRKRKHLAKLKSAAERLRKVLREFDGLGRPGWPLLRRGAELHAEETKQRLDELIRLKRRIDQNRDPLGGQPKSQSLATALQAENAERSWHEQVFFAYQKFGAAGILFNAKLAAEAIIQWHDLPNQKMTQQEIDRLLASPSDQQDHINALRSLMVDLAEIYRNHFRREFSFSRPSGGGEPRGPAMRFTRAVFDELEIKNDDGNSFSPEGILRYWPRKP